MYLVDTSVWIDFFRERDNKATQKFYKLLDNKMPIGLTSLIYQEILQGVSSQKDFDLLNHYLITQRFYKVKHEINSYQQAAQIYLNCRKKGITIRSTIDCLIAQIAIENNLILLHNDNDLCKIKLIEPSLELADCLG